MVENSFQDNEKNTKKLLSKGIGTRRRQKVIRPKDLAINSAVKGHYSYTFDSSGEISNKN